MISTVFTGKLPPTNLYANKNVSGLECRTRQYNSRTNNWVEEEEIHSKTKDSEH